MRINFNDVEEIAFSIDKEKNPVLYDKFMTLWAMLKDGEYNVTIIAEGENSKSKHGRYGR